MPFHQNISKSIISGSGRRTTISADSRDQYPLIDLLMTSSSCLEAVHVVEGGQEGGGFEKSIDATNASTYLGAGFRVDLVERDEFPLLFEFVRLGVFSSSKFDDLF